MVYHRAILQRAFFLSLTLFIGYVQGQDVVKLQENINGKLMTTRNGRNISAYLGIPYAEPPIGPLRFKNPILWNQWNGPITADTDASECPQINNDGMLIGNEDCLFLNVYTPKIYPDSPYPVMVYFHGGSFVRGSSKEAGPEYLLDKDIVLVTVNYRLGVLGFLSTYDEAASGNFGLKDQALALQWVRTNIFGFGGNPRRVTIFGHEAGGASTVLHAISDTSKDLFDQFITQSGSPISFWYFADDFHDHYKKHAKDLGDYVKCPTGKSIALVECLRSLDPYTLVNSDSIFNGDNIFRYRTWVPTTEPTELAGSFITRSPGELSIWKSDWIKDCPAIVGTVSDEGLVLTADLYVNDTLYKSLVNRLDSVLIDLLEKSVANGDEKETLKKVKKFYFESVNMDDKETLIRTMTNVISDNSFTFPAVLQVWMMEELNSPYYMYKFDYRGSDSKTSDIISNNDNVGVSQGDDFRYLFPIRNSTIQPSESDNKMIDVMVDLWTSFAYNGVPTSQYISDLNMWKRFIPGEKSLRIGNGADPLAMSFESPLEDVRFLFWNQLILGEFFESMADGF